MSSSSRKINSASSSRTSSPAPSSALAGTSTQPIDPYRTLSTQVKKPILPLLPSEPPNLPSLLHLNSSTYSSRLSGKTLQSSDPFPTGSGSGSTAAPAASALVKGKKRNRGNQHELAKASSEARAYEKGRKELGLEGMRKVKRRLGPTMGRGMKVSYNALLPLHNLHTTYLIQLMSLPPLQHGSDPNDSLTTSTSPSPNPNQNQKIGFNSETVLSKLSKADFTGISLHVLSSRNKSLEGINGIVIEETASTFRLVTVKDKVKVIPKDGTLFRLSIPAHSPGPSFTSDPRPESSTSRSTPIAMDVDAGANDPSFTGSEEGQSLDHFLSICPRMEIDLLGSSFAYRSGDRAGRKFRPAQGGNGGSGWAEEWVKSDWEGVFSQLAEQLGEDTGSDGKERTKERGTSNGAVIGLRKRGKSRRKDPPAGGSLQVY